jgi:V-type H+-transporting ATPase subunit a
MLSVCFCDGTDELQPGDSLVEKTVFIIFYQGDRSQAKIKKICESFNANTYQIPDSPSERKTFLDQVNSRLEDLVNV